MYNLAMINVTLTCHHCKSENIVRNGLTRNGKQRYKCYDCERTSRDQPQSTGYSLDKQQTILRAYEERSSLRGLERIFGVSRKNKTVATWLKKKEQSFHL
jgi:transposase-like protein